MLTRHNRPFIIAGNNDLVLLLSRGEGHYRVDCLSYPMHGIGQGPLQAFA